jgi:hypothetical protein
VTVPIVVDASAAHPSTESRDLLAAWVATRGGRIVSSNGLDDLPNVLAVAIPPVSRAQTWNPMRSTGWLLLFTFALSAEWWLRRRRGLR